jgi:hypothetical protein
MHRILGLALAASAAENSAATGIMASGSKVTGIVWNSLGMGCPGLLLVGLSWHVPHGADSSDERGQGDLPIGRL